MSLNFKKSYKFALKSSLYVSVFATSLAGIVEYFFFFTDWPSLSAFLAALGIPLFIFSFFVIQYRVEVFIYRRVKKIYDDVSFLDASSLRKQPITTDMATLTREVKKFATEKKIEIETLKEREEYRREFLGNVSHELKTPLFTVQGYLLTLLDGAMNDKNIRKKYLQRAEKGVERLIYIVQDLDMITKLETGTVSLSISEFNIIEVVQAVFDLLEMKAEQKNIILTFDNKYVRPILVAADREKVQQVVMNLVVNAIKYGRQNGSVEVGFEDLTEEKIIVRVTDDGEGIEKQHIPRLFERFYRVDKSGGREEGGSGLGLSIVKHIVEAHDEAIFVESTPGKGSEFSFTLEKAK
ncbi:MULTISPECIES: cell wall metabolism sensor histidine kinase WalK [unclassified Flavobacterium]|uniref:sensor histidine kinase n=1 Tax=unclassified Flavobacterium TaxID=196869 RepID=UPI001F1486A9|nr:MULTISPECIES: ATP-binding protein [unclassified Flavobacterium]UMY66681.1 ATP-binding protein [Flavobacterium sp. HJ-32-4]